MPALCRLPHHDLCDKQCEALSPEESRRRAYAVVRWIDWGLDGQPRGVAAIGPLTEGLLWMATSRVGPTVSHYAGNAGDGGQTVEKLSGGGFTSGRKCVCAKAEYICGECVASEKHSRGWMVYDDLGGYYGRSGDWFGGASDALPDSGVRA
jgi:hypothetical protein